MRAIASLLAAAVLALAPPARAGAADFPDTSRTLRLVVPFAAGGGVDSAARVLANDLQRRLGLTVLVDNRAGANGTIGGKFVETAPADGYTLLFSAATHVLARQVMAHPPYDPAKDFVPVARVGEAPLLLVISPELPAKDLAGVIAAAREKPGRWSAAIPAAGAPSHLATLLLAKEGRLTFTFVPYKGTQPALTDVAGGHTHLLMDSMVSLLPLAKAGRVRPIAITSAKRSPLAPEIPTAREAGLPMTFASWYGVWAPRGTPADHVRLLNAAINASVAEQAKAGAWANLGIEPVQESPDQFARFITRDIGQSAELLKNAGFKPE
jgi:tripartite-type tricarboxylate transporter receptor subunit TctC